MTFLMKLIAISSMLFQQNTVFSFKRCIDTNFRRQQSTSNQLSMSQPYTTQSIKLSAKTNIVACTLLLSSMFGCPGSSLAVSNIPTIDSIPEKTFSSSSSLSSPFLLSGEEMISPKASRVNKFIKLPSGVDYYDAIEGEGTDVVKEGSSVQFQWVLRRSNGYFVDASSNYDNEPFIYKVGNTKKVIAGLDEGIRGMKVNGVRRINVPPKYAFVEGVGDGKPGPMPAGFGPRRQIETRLDREVWFFEVKLTKLRN